MGAFPALSSLLDISGIGCFAVFEAYARTHRNDTFGWHVVIMQDAHAVERNNVLTRESGRHRPALVEHALYGRKSYVSAVRTNVVRICVLSINLLVLVSIAYT